MSTTATRRLDLWLWYARFFRTRSSANRACDRRRMRVNSVPVRKPSQPVRVGDVLTLPHRGKVRVVRVNALGLRRASAAEARQLFVGVDEHEPAVDRIT